MRLLTPLIGKLSLLFLTLWVVFLWRLYLQNASFTNPGDHPPNIYFRQEEAKNLPKKAKQFVPYHKDSREIVKSGSWITEPHSNVLKNVIPHHIREMGTTTDSYLGMILNDADAEAFRQNEKHDFNAFLSDRIPLTRNLPDVRPPPCVQLGYQAFLQVKVSLVISFHNEAASALLRTVQSIISRSAEQLIKEIILIDDASESDDLDTDLLQRLAQITPKTKIIRLETRHGLIRSRIAGARATTGDVIVFMDSHCEVNQGWLEPLLDVIERNRTTVACPVIDIIQPDTLEYVASPTVRGGFNWGLHFRWDSLSPGEQVNDQDNYPSPAMAGGIFAIDKRRFFEIGEYDEKMNIWGGENIELSLRIWMCGGSLVIVPCSRVGHIFRNRRPYGNAGFGDTQLTNSVRLAHIWLGNYIEKFFEARPEARHVVPGDLSSRIQLRENLHCRSFQWYLDTVYPDAINQTKYSRLEPGVSRYTDKFRLVHVASGLCLNAENSKNADASLIHCDKSRRQMVYQADDSNRAIVLSKKLCLDSDCKTKDGTDVGGVCAKKCTFTGGSQAWLYRSNTTNSTAILNLTKGLCLAYSANTLLLLRCNEQRDFLQWRLEH